MDVGAKAGAARTTVFLLFLCVTSDHFIFLICEKVDHIYFILLSRQGLNQVTVRKHLA